MSAAGDRHLVEWDGEELVFVRRLGDADVDAAGDWLDIYLQGDYFFKRRHLRGILTRGKSEGWGVEVDGLLIGVVIIYEGSRLHNLYLAPEWRSRGVGGALLRHFKPATVRAKTNMLAADPTAFYERQGYRVVGQDPNRPWILEMARGEENGEMHVAPNAPGRTISAPGGPGVPPAAAAAVVPGSQVATLPLAPPAASSAPPSPGRLTTDQVAAIAAGLRSLSDDELVAAAHAAATFQHWKRRQQAARERRLERERQQAAADAGVHLDPNLTGEARARVARARAAAAIDGMFGAGANGQPIPPHSE